MAFSYQGSATTEFSNILPVANETMTISQRSRLPVPNDRGDYRRTPHRTWKVVDVDPNGLNCRMINMTYEELFNPRNNVELDIVNWPIVGTLKQEQRFRINLGPAGFGVMYDTQNKPWMFVEQTLGNNSVSRCFVRANYQFVQPIN
ncbi:MAG: hypothetical protein WBA77_09995 [Microcoleaceae cyanobacterium]